MEDISRQKYNAEDGSESTVDGRQLRYAFYRITPDKASYWDGWDCQDGIARVPARFVGDSGWYLVADDAADDHHCPVQGPFPTLRTALVVLTLQG